MVLSLVMAVSAMAQEAKTVSKVLITNASILDSNKAKLAEGMIVLVEGKKIARIAKSIPAPDGATVIDAKGRTITPGPDRYACPHDVEYWRNANTVCSA